MNQQPVIDSKERAASNANTCPNCGFAASGNYCANCGQQTKLHKDTFWGLISHFTAHYFHYDSKFWQTLKALVFSPGKLTIAYQEKKRQRYIPPISLYIFISIVFFLLLPIFQRQFIQINSAPKAAKTTQVDLSKKPSIEKTAEAEAAKQGRQVGTGTKYAARVSDGLLTDLSDHPMEFKERLLHAIPKVFFFMIPLLAALLKLFLIRQKQFYFVDHAVFALHVHSFVFILCLIGLINPFQHIQYQISDIILIVCLLYYILAIRRVYKSGWIKSVLVGLGSAALYFITLLLVVLIVLWILVETGH